MSYLANDAQYPKDAGNRTERSPLAMQSLGIIDPKSYYESVGSLSTDNEASSATILQPLEFSKQARDADSEGSSFSPKQQRIRPEKTEAVQEVPSVIVPAPESAPASKSSAAATPDTVAPQGTSGAAESAVRQDTKSHKQTQPTDVKLKQQDDLTRGRDWVPFSARVVSELVEIGEKAAKWATPRLVVRGAASGVSAWAVSRALAKGIPTAAAEGLSYTLGLAGAALVMLLSSDEIGLDVHELEEQERNLQIGWMIRTGALNPSNLREITPRSEWSDYPEGPPVDPDGSVDQFDLGIDTLTYQSPSTTGGDSQSYGLGIQTDLYSSPSQAEGSGIAPGLGGEYTGQGDSTSFGPGETTGTGSGASDRITSEPTTSWGMGPVVYGPAEPGSPDPSEQDPFTFPSMEPTPMGPEPPPSQGSDDPSTPSGDPDPATDPEPHHDPVDHDHGGGHDGVDYHGVDYDSHTGGGVSDIA